MQVIKLSHSLEALTEALRDGAKVLAVGSHESGCGHWYKVYKTNCGIIQAHESGRIILTAQTVASMRDVEYIAII